jgi:hypothetical protein
MSKSTGSILEKNFDRALAFASNLGDTYTMASPQVRRNLNQSMFEEIAIEVHGSIVRAPMQLSFAAFRGEGFRGRILNEAKTNSGPLVDPWFELGHFGGSYTEFARPRWCRKSGGRQHPC